MSKQKVWSRFEFKIPKKKKKLLIKLKEALTEYEGEDPKTFK